jgi:hypothetical protein
VNPYCWSSRSFADLVEEAFAKELTYASQPHTLFSGVGPGTPMGIVPDDRISQGSQRL